MTDKNGSVYIPSTGMTQVLMNMDVDLKNVSASLTRMSRELGRCSSALNHESESPSPSREELMRTAETVHNMMRALNLERDRVARIGNELHHLIGEG